MPFDADVHYWIYLYHQCHIVNSATWVGIDMLSTLEQQHCHWSPHGPKHTLYRISFIISRVAHNSFRASDHRPVISQIGEYVSKGICQDGNQKLIHAFMSLAWVSTHSF